MTLDKHQLKHQTHFKEVSFLACLSQFIVLSLTSILINRCVYSHSRPFTDDCPRPCVKENQFNI